ncbi:DUF5103 domain-containing protein [Fulvivirga maritima]|nr:type IX secretion system plug protein domain-containing protein [Fulvivirga maritima]UII29549.1 DUF5103 domain-containing protein [Fulvivirga maritima]
MFSQNKKLLYKNATYEFETRTVQLYSGNNTTNPATALLGRNNLTLEFDDLVEAEESYRVKIIHCDRDWSPSKLKAIDYLYDFNEFNINNYKLSVDTKIAYVHYTFRVPNVKIPGNYLLVVYRGTDESDIILSHRFMIYANNVGIALTSNLKGMTSMDRSRQQLDFTINYENYPIQNPGDIQVVIRQNQRWDNAITDLKPSMIKEHSSELDYKYFNNENSFYAGNEFRFFDMQSIRYPGQNVQRTNFQTRPTSAQLMVDKPRIYQPYTQYDDLNGNFFISNTDTGNGPTQSDYLTVYFYLQAEQIEGDVYLVGNMNNWELDTPLKYNASNNMYTCDMILKQGHYNFQYLVKSKELTPNYLEGNHFETENNYEILVYYKPPSMRSEILIGYASYTMNPVD